MPFALVLAATLVASVPAGLTYRSAVTLTTLSVNLGDLADTSHLPVRFRARAAALELFRAPPHAGRISVTAARLNERVKALMPVLAAWLPAPSLTAIVAQIALEPTRTTASARTSRCAKVVKAADAGEPLREDMFEDAACGGNAPAVAHFDTALRISRATRTLAVGELVEVPSRSSMPVVVPGQPLEVSVQVGPVRIERRVVAVQGGRPGGRLFVQTEDGTVFATALEDARP